ncbi:MAG: DinB family protein [Planctomycetota bacterium]
MSALAGHLRRVFAHLRWADTETLVTLQQHAAGAVARARFMHVIAAEHVWLSRLRGTQQELAVWPEFTSDGCRRWMERNHRELEALLAGADDDALRRPVRYTNSAGQAFTDTAADILEHVALHGSWHRGQIAVLLRQDGGVPAPTDYIAFVRGAPAARTEPSAGAPPPDG